MPAQRVLDGTLDATLTFGVKTGFTVIVIVFDVAGDPVTHVAFDVICTDITSPSFKVLVV